MNFVFPFIKYLVEEQNLIKHVKIGDIIDHPDGYQVKIVDGSFWGTYGVSNFWTWKKIKKDGSLTKKEYHGYGWWVNDIES